MRSLASLNSLFLDSASVSRNFLTTTFCPPDDNSAVKTVAKPTQPISSVFTNSENLKHGKPSASISVAEVVVAS